MQKERFKIFVRNHPVLVNHVRNKKMTWQQFYELYDLYGEDNGVWDTFLNDTSVNNNGERSSVVTNNSTNPNLVNSLKDFMKLFKGIDLNTVQKALGSIDKAIETFKGIGLTDSNNSDRNTYEERPKYKYFED